MFNIIPISLLITAIGGIIYVVSNHLSEFSDEDKENKENNDKFQFNFKTRLVEWINQLPLDNVKSQSLSLTQKLLHRFRLTLLKTDNYLMKLISKISEKDKQINGSPRSGYGGAGNNSGSQNNNGIDFWENLSRVKEEERIVEPAIPLAGTEETKIELAVDKNKKIEKFFDIKPSKISLETSEGKPAKKTLKKKKSSPPAGRAGK